MKLIHKLGLAAAVAAILVSAPPAAAEGEGKSPTVAKVTPAPAARRQAFEFAYEDINPASPSFGKKLALGTLYAQHGVVLNFLASWCPPCWHEVPALTQMAGEIKTPVVCVAADEYGPPSDLLQQAAHAGLKLPIVLVPKDKIAEMEAHYDHGMLPTTYWIGKQGTILEKKEGQQSMRDLVMTTRKIFPTSAL